MPRGGSCQSGCDLLRISQPTRSIDQDNSPGQSVPVPEIRNQIPTALPPGPRERLMRGWQKGRGLIRCFRYRYWLQTTRGPSLLPVGAGSIGAGPDRSGRTRAVPYVSDACSYCSWGIFEIVLATSHEPRATNHEPRFIRAGVWRSARGAGRRRARRPGSGPGSWCGSRGTCLPA